MEKENQEVKGKVPNLKLSENKEIQIQTKQIPLKVNGKDTVVTVKKLSTGVRNKIRSNCTKIKIIGGQQNVIVDDSEIQEKLLEACIVEAPFEINLATIKNLPAEVSDYLFAEYSEFAEPTDKKKD